MNVVITSVRNEAPYLIEWVAWQIYIGFDKVIVYTNHNTDNTLEVLQNLRNKGVVEFFELNPSGNIKPQMHAFSEGLKWTKKNRPDWVCCLDPDEYLLFNRDLNLHQFLARYTDAHAIAINWRLFGSGGLQCKGLGLTVERFLMAAKPEYYQHAQFKTIFRYHDSIQRFHHRVLFPEPLQKQINYIYSDGIPLEYESRLPNAKLSQVRITYDYAQLNHYAVRSISEFEGKMERGNGIESLGPNKRNLTYLNKFDHNDLYESRIINHLPGYIKIYQSLII